MTYIRGIVLMACLGVGALAQEGEKAITSYWIEARDTSPVSIPFDITVQVWAWAKSGAEAEVTLQGKRFAAPVSSGKNARPYEWVALGTAELTKGDLALKLGEGIAAVALSDGAVLDPQDTYMASRVFDQPRGADDKRLEVEHHTGTVFMMPPYTMDSWKEAKETIRIRMLAGCGLWPLPEKTPLNAKIFDRVQHGDYSVEKVYFESHPGFYVTGNLYRPAGKDGAKVPGVVMPHGHWEHGRLEDTDTCSVPGRGIALARMGMTAFTYDMVGYVDSQQLEHRWRDQKELLWGLHPFGLQLWSSIRAVDFILSLPEVDPARIGCTGASGGGTQTFALTSVDDRVTVSAPVNMISSTMQGGCICENAPLIRLGHSNMEIGATMAPRPMMMIAATGDWTAETPRIEYPAIKSIYELYGAGGNVETHQVDAGHNYNKESREAVYRFFAKHLLGKPQPDLVEAPFQVEPEAALRVFPDKQLPKGALTGDKLKAKLVASTEKKIEAILPKDEKSYASFLTDFTLDGALLADVLGVRQPEAGELAVERFGFEDAKEIAIERWAIGSKELGDRVPAILYRARNDERLDTVIIVHGEGKAAQANQTLVDKTLESGRAALVIDAFLLGEHSSPFATAERLRKGGFHDTFNVTDTGCRIQDVLTAVAFIKARRDLSGRIGVVGLGDGGMWSLFAAAVSHDIAWVTADMNEFDPNDDAAWVERFYIPSIRSLGDIATAAALIAPRPLSIVNVSKASRLDDAERAYNSVKGGSWWAREGVPSPESLIGVR